MTFFGLADLSLGLNIKVLNGDDRDVLLGIQFFIIWYFTSQDFFGIHYYCHGLEKLNVCTLFCATLSTFWHNR